MNIDSRTAKGSDTRSRILDCARELLVCEGYDNMVLREVAKRAGIKLGNLQYYFSTRDDLLAALIEIEGRTDAESVRATLADPDKPDEAVRALTRFLVQRWRGEGGVAYATLNFLAIHKPAFLDLRRSVYEAFYREIETAIECGDPGLSKQIYRDRARLLTSLIDGAAMQMQIGPKRRFLDQVADQALAIALPDGVTCE